jgi:uncharacterized membrane protein YgaE (UPF0421/DUF939 family)
VFKKILNNQTLSHVVIMITAATAAYLIASQTTFINPTIATLIALISVKQTLQETLQETSYQMVGTLIGAALAILLSESFGFQWWTIPIFIATSFLLSIIFKLGIRGGTIISITIIFITAPFIDETITSQQRIFGVALGIILAAVASLIPLKQQSHVMLQNNIAQSKKQLRELLNIIGLKLSAGEFSQKEITQWIVEAETERSKIREYNQEYTHLEKTQKWSPVLTKTLLKTIKDDLAYTTQKALATKNITHILQDIINLKTPPKKAMVKIGQIIQQTSNINVDTSSIDTISKETLDELENTQAIILTSTLYSETKKLKENKRRNKT